MRLWIIGNGFDLAHGLHTNYLDYHGFLIDNGKSWIVRMLECFFGNNCCEHKNILWSHLEKALGIYNVEDVYSYLKDGHVLDVEHVSQYIAEVDAEIQYHFVDICEAFNETFQSWVYKIDLNTVMMNTLFAFFQTDLFLSFNYTDTLEKVYCIDDEKVLHIHGRATVQDKLIVGHDQTAKIPIKIQDDILDNTANLRAIVDTINRLKKNPEQQIRRNQKFFDGLREVDSVIVYGHSIENVDFPYFKEVRRSVDAGAHWIISCYDKENVNRLYRCG